MRRGIRILKFIILTIFSIQRVYSCVCSQPYLTIDSLQQLKKYDFIALVKITDDQDYKKATEKDMQTIGKLTFTIIELFKGNEVNFVLEYSKNSSCDMGIENREEWVLFGTTSNGNLTIEACDRNQQYKDSNGTRDWEYKRGFYELSQLRKLFQHPLKKYENEKRSEYYDNKRLEIEETYINGKLNGQRTIWYPNGKVMCKQNYINDTLDGKAEWFYATGQISDEDYYYKGEPCNVSRTYYDSTIEKGYQDLLITDIYKTKEALLKAYHKIQVQHEIVFDSYGRAIVSREYSRTGKIEREETRNPDAKFNIVIYYHDNGNISSIMYSLDGKNFGHYQEYDEKGFPKRGWDYDKEGQVIRSK